MSAPATDCAAVVKQVKDALSMVAVVGEHVVLKKSGSHYTGLCPFHQERSPSFSVSEEKQLYHCYGCKAGGDLIQFVMEIGGVSFNEALEELAERAGISLPKTGREGSGPDSRKLDLAYRLNRYVANVYRKALTSEAHQAVRTYFGKRGVTEEVSRAFYLGYAPEGWEFLAKQLTAAKAPLEIADQLGLLKKSQKPTQKPGETNYYDVFRNRAIFPILDPRGRVSGFGGRALSDEDKPKYLNSADSPVFQKNKVAFGLFQAKKHIREQDTIIVVEGYFDVLVLHAHGFENAVATCGTALSTQHLEAFARMAQKIIIMFDSDHAGQEARLKAMELGLTKGLILYSVQLPQGMDPDEFLISTQPGHGREGMQKLFQTAAPILDTELEAAFTRARESVESKSQAIKKIAEWLSLLTDPVGRGAIGNQLLGGRVGRPFSFCHRSR